MSRSQRADVAGIQCSPWKELIQYGTWGAQKELCGGWRYWYTLIFLNRPIKTQVRMCLDMCGHVYVCVCLCVNTRFHRPGLSAKRAEKQEKAPGTPGLVSKATTHPRERNESAWGSG